MKTIIIPTTQNIELEYPIATGGERFFAGVIDMLVYILYYVLIFYLIVTTPFGDQSLPEYWYSQTAIFQILTLPALGYSFLMEFFFNGQTLGKMLMKLRTIRVDGTSTTLSNYLIRWTLRLIDIWLSLFIFILIFGGDVPFIPGLIGLITIAFTKKNQRIGDLAAGTTVVKLKLVTTFGDTIFVDTGEDYKVKFPEIQRLSDRDISILKEVLEAGIKSSNPQLLRKLSNKVKSVAKIETNMPPRQFLRTLLQDYNHIYGRNE